MPSNTSIVCPTCRTAFRQQIGLDTGNGIQGAKAGDVGICNVCAEVVLYSSATTVGIMTLREWLYWTARNPDEASLIHGMHLGILARNEKEKHHGN